MMMIIMLRLLPFAVGDDSDDESDYINKVEDDDDTYNYCFFNYDVIEYVLVITIRIVIM